MTEPTSGDLADGTYDVFVVDAVADDPDDVDGVVHLELTVTSGEHKGGVVALAASGLGRSDIDLLGMPGTLTVAGDTPSFAVDD